MLAESCLIVDSIYNPGDHKCTPADTQDVGDMVNCELLVCSVNNNQGHLSSISTHTYQGRDCQPGASFVNKKKP